jgi:hypothetical protein
MEIQVIKNIFISSLAQSLFLISAIATVHVIMQEKLQFKKLFIYFLILFFGLVIISALPIEAQKSDRAENLLWMIECVQKDKTNISEILDIQIAISPEKRQELMRKAKYHTKMAAQTLQAANAKCCLLPEGSYRDYARYCFSTFMCGMIPGTPMSKMISILIASLTSYGIGVMNEWQEIQSLLLESQYHYEMKEFYELCLIEA